MGLYTRDRQLFGYRATYGLGINMKTYLEQLEAIQSVIENIEANNQSYSIDGMSMNRANLADLYKRESYLRAMVAREENGNKLNIQYIIR
jgi:hypothetical protein